MAARSFVQSDTVAPCGTIQACAGNVTGTLPRGWLAVEGGGAGSTGLLVTSRNQRSVVMFELAPGQASWSAGTWTVPVNVTGANANMTIKAGYVCRRTSACAAVSTVASVTGLTIVCTSGVKTVTIPGGSLSVGTASDVAYIVIEITTPGTTQSCTITPNQTITTPIQAALAATSAAAMAPVTSAGAGNQVLSGAAAAEMAPVASVAAGNPILSGVTAATMAPASALAAGNLVSRCVGAAAMAPATMTGAGGMVAPDPIVGVAAMSMAPTTSSGAGRTVVRGTGEATLAPATMDGEGGYTPQARGTIIHPGHAKVFILT